MPEEAQREEFPVETPRFLQYSTKKSKRTPQKQGTGTVFSSSSGCMLYTVGRSGRGAEGVDTGNCGKIFSRWQMLGMKSRWKSGENSARKTGKTCSHRFSTGETIVGQGVINIFHRVFHNESRKGKVFYVDRIYQDKSGFKKNFFAKNGINSPYLYGFYGESQRNRGFVAEKAHFYLKFAAEYATIYKKLF